MKFLLTILLFPFICYAQTDTLAGAVAYKNTTFDDAPVMGRTTSGGIYAFFFIDQFDGVTRTNIKVARVDLTNGTISYKILDNPNLSGNRFLGFDSLGNYYVDVSRTIYKFNMKDSIYYENLHGISLDIGALAYCGSLGLDGNFYFGASSGCTCIAMYNPHTDVTTRFNEIDPFQDYVLQIVSDSANIYAEVGQRDSNYLWTLRKSDGAKRKLFAVSNATRFNIETKNNGKIYTWFTGSASSASGTYELHNGTATFLGGAFGAGIPLSAKRITYYEVNNPDVGGYPRIFTFFDQSQSAFQYNSVANTPSISGSIPVATNNFPTSIQYVFFNSTDTTGFYYIGYLYGTWYWYSFITGTSTPLGRSGYNIYSAVQLNDSIIEAGGYPSGVFLRFHTNLVTHPWDVQKLDTVNHYVPDGSEAGNNPRREGYLHDVSEMMHIFGMIKDSNGNIVCSGDVIRTSFGFGLGAAKVTGNNVTALEGVQAMDSLGYVSMDLWKKNVLVSTNNYYGGTTPKIYVYNSVQNRILDSINLGLLDNGQIYVVGDKLIGITNNRIYKYDLSARKLIDSIKYASNSIGTSLMLSDGRIMICTNNNLPANFWLFAKLPYSTLPYFEFNKTLYFIAGNVIKRVRNFLFSYHSNNESFQRLFYIKKQLGL